MDLVEGVGESSPPPSPPPPPQSFGSVTGYEIVNDVCNRLLEIGNQEAYTNPEFRDQLEAHFNRLPASYAMDINMDRVEDVLLHQKLLLLAKDPENRPVFHVRLLENFWSQADVDDDQQEFTEGLVLSHVRQDVMHVPVHEVIISTIDKPKLLSQLSALLSGIELNIREAHVFSTTDGYSLDVFVVDGWPLQETDALHEAMGKAIARSEGSWSGSSPSKSAVEKDLATQADFVHVEIDKRFLMIGERIASGSCGDLYRGVYLGQDVAVKVFRSEHIKESQEAEFAHEVAILREVQHRNVVRFIGACTEKPHLCIVTEYMPGGSLYDYMHKNHNILVLPQLLKFAIDVCKGMDYLHKRSIIHRDLKTANLLMDGQNVIKVADFGVARYENQEGAMTAETGTYRWMAPEVMNHQQYDQKADVFSFGIVLWELVTAKVPYGNMTPLQAALGVRQGLRPDVPRNTHPKLVKLMQRCWETIPARRPSFAAIKLQLQRILQVGDDGQGEGEAGPSGS